MSNFEDWLFKNPYNLLTIIVIIFVLLLAFLVTDVLLFSIISIIFLAGLLIILRFRLLEKRIIIPLPDFLEKYLGNVCSLCLAKVERGKLFKVGEKWVCEKCKRELDGRHS